MNKFLLFTILSVLVINLTSKLINAVSIGGKAISNSEHKGIKRYVLKNHQ